jgi:polyhydroxybutyrate depolymerase
MLQMLTLPVAFVLAAASFSAAAPRGRSTWHELQFDGVQRSFLVFCPEDCQAKNSPLMIVLHGGLGNAQAINENTGMDEIAEKERFVVAYPNGTELPSGPKNRRTWNAGECCGAAAQRKIDDVGFIEKVIQQIGQAYGTDSRRVYVAGMSNGGMMAYRLAREIPDKIAAIAAVSASLTVEDIDRARNVAVLHIHGSDDKFVPVAGGIGEKSLAGVSFRPLADTIRLITRARTCEAPVVRSLADGIQSSSYRCSSGAPVEVVLIQGGPHGWPGSQGHRAVPGLRRDFSASRYAWEFVRNFSLNTPGRPQSLTVNP